MAAVYYDNGTVKRAIHSYNKGAIYEQARSSKRFNKKNRQERMSTTPKNADLSWRTKKQNLVSTQLLRYKYRLYE
ncbi:hypothetical protein KSB_92070 [Ktedonobacter robiniae]|uniref:Transglycosylase SLT domain-containing protein n=1 Tax=Ktedonobacter robiniae TaxID=2778365 RepID=A0ABQ3V870_9CHLR|nr:hypothetical protein KSB_92070 [Ktedonobacter robiniae]GHO63555.1 hypothetical protein KSC_024470 [Ktedonobacter sp. SOSP1-52]GHO68375.1 hypothetical protein KSC_072670 [Ktedonobacter sp. SOSP1-52]